MSKFVLYHSGCPDGFGAAWAAWRVLGDSARYVPVRYGDAPPTNLGPSDEVFVVDFSFKRDVLLELKDRVGNLVVLDHHKTAEADLEGLDWCVFDQTHSGAVITWNYFHGEAALPPLLAHIEDRDLWKWELHNSKEISAALYAYEFDFNLWSEFSDDVGRLVREGVVIMRLQRKLVAQTASSAVLGRVGGYEVPIVCASQNVSEIGEYLCEHNPGRPFAAIYRDRGDRRQWSLRSRYGFDVSEVAEKYGGGGHASAAGFETQIAWVGV